MSMNPIIRFGKQKWIATALVLAVILTADLALIGFAYGGWNAFQVQGDKVEAIPNHEYYLTDSSGLWFILAKKFSGPEARRNANRVVYELRKRYKLPAYIYQYNSDEEDLAALSKKNGTGSGKFRYQNAAPDEYIVLVGSFPAVDDPTLQETLLKVKRSKLDSLKNDRESQQLITEFEFLARKDKEYTGYGPLGKAIAVPNPLIPKDFFSQKGIVDPFIEKINGDSPYNLLNNKSMYTVRVATFGGNDAFKKDWDEKRSRLADAGAKASILCETLRKKGVEAWEFHDRDASFVTIGSFDNYGVDGADGVTELNPEIYQLMEKYRGELLGGNGTFQTRALKVTVENPKARGLNTEAKKVDLELSFDLRPVIIVVPQRPGNSKKVQQAQMRLRHTRDESEMDRLSESLAANSTEHSRKYGDRMQEALDRLEDRYGDRMPEALDRLSEEEVMAAANSSQRQPQNQSGLQGQRTTVAYPPTPSVANTMKTGQSMQRNPQVTNNAVSQRPMAQGTVPAQANMQNRASAVSAQAQNRQPLQSQTSPQTPVSSQRQTRSYAPATRVANGMAAPTY